MNLNLTNTNSRNILGVVMRIRKVMEGHSSKSSPENAVLRKGGRK